MLLEHLEVITPKDSMQLVINPMAPEKTVLIKLVGCIASFIMGKRLTSITFAASSDS